MFILKVCFLGTFGDPNNPQKLPPSVLTVMKTVKMKTIIVRLQPGLINKQGILPMNKTSIIMVLKKEMV